MMKVKIPYYKKVDTQALNEAVLPIGYSADFLSEGRFGVVNDDSVNVGSCELVGDGLVFTFQNELTAGLDFISAFASLYPDYNPAQRITGFVRKGENGMYRLDVTPLRHSLGFINDELVRFVIAQRLFYVIFYRGNWTSDSLSVFSMRLITFDNQLGDEMGEAILSLGNIEN